MNISRKSTAVAQRGQAPPQGETDEMDSGLVNILLVEDNPDDERLIREMLAGAENREYHLECVDRVGRSQPLLWCNGTSAAILLDLSLPDSEGLETIRWVQDIAKGRPIVALSGTDDEELAVQAVKRGAQDCLVKGVLTPKMLARCLDCAIERNRLHEETSLLARIVESSDDAIIGKTLDGKHRQLEREARKECMAIPLRRQSGIPSACWCPAGLPRN